MITQEKEDWLEGRFSRCDYFVCPGMSNFSIVLSALRMVNSQLCSLLFMVCTHTISDRLWTSLFSLAASCTSPWLVAGDFHSVLFSSDRINGALVSTYESRDFATCVEDCELYELKSKGSYFSWTSKGAVNGRVASRIDRGLANSLWMQAFPHVEVDYLLPGLSDHSPLLFQCATVERGNPFRFLNVLAEHEHFLMAKRMELINCNLPA